MVSKVTVTTFIMLL